MATRTEIELEKAWREWEHPDDISQEFSDELSDEQGTEVPLGETGRNTPIVPLHEDLIGPVNNPHPTQPDQKTFELWPDQGDDFIQTSSLRPTEDLALNKISRKKKKHHS